MVILRDKSLEIKTGLRKSFQDENSKVANRICYGYSKLSDGTLTVNEAEAEVVRFIFERYNQGDSLGRIAKQLESMCVVSPTGKAKWNREAISKLLSNEKYVGKVMLQKTHNFVVFSLRMTDCSQRYCWIIITQQLSRWRNLIIHRS